MFGLVSSKGDVTSMDPQVGFVRSRKRFKAYTWKYKKSITPLASFVLLVNQILGFGMTEIPSLMREGGWLPTLLANVLVCVLATLCSLMLLRAMALIPHNENFDQRIEYNTLVKYYLSDRNFKLVALLNHVGDLCGVVCAILMFAKIIDMLFVNTLGWTLAWQVYPYTGFGRVDMKTVSAIYESSMIPSSSEHSVTLAITLGYLICAVICLRLSACALEETMGFHLVSFMALLGCIAQMSIMGASRYFGNGIQERMPTVGKLRFGTMVLAFVDNYTLASSTPSWANEMTSDVKVMKTVWTSSFFSCCVFHIMGYILGSAFPSNSDSIVIDLLISKMGAFTNGAVCLFVMVTVLPDIVFGSISTKYNLLNLGYCGGGSAYFWGCVFPFTFTWLLSKESVFMHYLGHISLTCSLFCDFFIPVVVYKEARKCFSSYSSHGSLDNTQGYRSDSWTSDLWIGGHNNQLLKKGTSILFGKIGSLGRSVTREYLTRPILESQDSKETEMEPNASNESHIINSDDDSRIDYLSFKIIKPPPVPRSDDHQYNTISKQRRRRSVSFREDQIYTTEEEYIPQTDAKSSKADSKANRVELLPFILPEEQHDLIAKMLLLILGGFTILPAIMRLKASL